MKSNKTLPDYLTIDIVSTFECFKIRVMKISTFVDLCTRFFCLYVFNFAIFTKNKSNKVNVKIYACRSVYIQREPN